MEYRPRYMMSQHAAVNGDKMSEAPGCDDMSLQKALTHNADDPTTTQSLHQSARTPLQVLQPIGAPTQYSRVRALPNWI